MMQAGNLSTEPELTVIVPVYNAARWLPGLLDTLRSQSMEDFITVFIDDGSTDSGPALLQEAAAEDRRFRVVTQANRGQAAARNTGLDILTTPWVTFIDTDDLLHPDAFALWMKEARRLGKGAVVKSAWIEDREKPSSFDRPIIPVSPMELGKEDAIAAYLYQSLPLTPVWGGVYDSAIFGERDAPGSVRFIEGMFYEDLEIGPRILDRARCVSFIARPLYFYRQHPDSFMHTFSSRRFDALRATELISGFISEHYPELRPAAADRRWSANFNIFLLLAKFGGTAPEMEKLRRHCWDVINAGKWGELTNPNVRLKNKLGALLSLIGPRAVKLVGRFAGA